MKKTSRLTKAILETANDMLEGGVIGEEAHKNTRIRGIGILIIGGPKAQQPVSQLGK